MKNTSLTLKLVLAIVAVLSLSILLQPLSQASAQPFSQTAPTGENCATGRTVNVSGTAVVNVIPDRALIQLGVESNGVTPKEVEAANARNIQKVIQAIQSQGVDPKDIVTDRYIVYPLYDSYDSLYIKGYRIDNLVAVTLRNVDQLSTVIVVALEAGANQVVQVELYTSELRKYRDQAREMAMQAAGEKAAALAAAAGADTGCILNINENTWSYYNGWWYSSARDLWTQNVVQNMAPGGNSSGMDSDGPVSLGQISVRAEVSATYALE